MPQSIYVQGKIPVIQEGVPVRFVYHRNTDKPENHTLHINNYLELYVFVRGNHQYIVENRLYELKRGDMILIHPRQVHKALPLQTCEYERFYLLLDADVFSGLAVDPLKPILSAISHKGNLISPDPQTREEVLRLLYGIRDSVERQDGQLWALGAVLALLDICSHQLRLVQPGPETISSVPELLKKILDYVTRNAPSIQSVAQIAHDLGMTPQYLSTYFSRQIGTPLKIYVQAKKIALAKDLLDQGADVTTACFDCGFNDCSYFIRVFKKYIGVTPLRYRQSQNKQLHRLDTGNTSG